MKKFICLALVCFSFIQAEEVLFEQDPTLLVSHFSIVIKTGSQDDSRDKVGLANLMSELVLRGTKTKSRTQFQTELEKIGATLAVHTSQDLVIFGGKVIKENTLEFLKLFQEALISPALSKTEFLNLKREISAEVSHLKNSNNRLGGIAARREVFAGSSLETTVVGRLKTLSNVTLEDVKTAYQTRFHRANIIFAVATSLPEATLKPELNKIWLGFPEGKASVRKEVQPQVPEAPKLVIIHKAKTSTGAMVIAQAGITAQDPYRYELTAANFAFGSEPLVSRLFRIIRGELGWTYAIGTTYNATGALSYQPGMFIISATPSVEFSAKTLFKSMSLWDEYLEKGLEKDELILAQDSLVNSYPFEFDSPEKRLAQKLNSLINDVPTLSPEDYEKTIRKISNSSIKKALNERHKKTSMIIALVADKDIVEKQLAEEQKDIPEAKRLKIAKVITPEQVIE